MKKHTAFIAAALMAAALSAPVSAQDSDMSALEILTKVDDAVNGAQDQVCTMKLVLVDRLGGEKTQELTMWQKGRDMRLARILTPAAQKGIAFLSLPNGVQYLYLPAFGKPQPLNAQIMSTSFTGTDFSYEDMQAGRQADRWDPAILKQDGQTIVLSLTPKQGKPSSYSKVLMTVTASTYTPVRIEHFDKTGKLVKVLVRQDYRQIDGYWVAMESTMEDVTKKHKTTMIVSDVRFDTGIPDDRFTPEMMGK
jgi:outer membrane lipoprotein-sorting protein